jgi:uncharacterized LabA/DUF88 family protein
MASNIGVNEELFAAQHLRKAFMISHPTNTTPIDSVVFADVENMSKAGLARAICIKSAAHGRCAMLKAYANWRQYKAQRFEFIEAGFETVDTIRYRGKRKNLVDLQIATDAVEFALLNPGIENFIVASGDADFVPLIRKLKQLRRRVVCITLSHGANQLRVEADAYEVVGPSDESDVLTHACISDIVRIAREVSAGKPIYLAVLGAAMKDQMPQFSPRKEFGLNWKSLLMLLEKHQLCKLQTVAAGGLLVRFTLSS